MLSSRASFRPKDRTCISYVSFIGRQVLYHQSPLWSPETVIVNRKGLKKAAAAAAKSLQSCPTLCDPWDGSPPGSPVPGILQARTLEWVAISFSNVWKWKWKWSRSVVSDSSQPHGLQPTRLFRPWDFPGKTTGVGCHCLFRLKKEICPFSSLKVPRHDKYPSPTVYNPILSVEEQKILAREFANFPLLSKKDSGFTFSVFSPSSPSLLRKIHCQPPQGSNSGLCNAE